MDVNVLPSINKGSSFIYLLYLFIVAPNCRRVPPVKIFDKVYLLIKVLFTLDNMRPTLLSLWFVGGRMYKYLVLMFHIHVYLNLMLSMVWVVPTRESGRFLLQGSYGPWKSWKTLENF